MITSVIELADALCKECLKIDTEVYSIREQKLSDAVFDATKAGVLSHICCNANDIGLPLSVVKQLLKGTGYEQLLS